MTEIQFQKATKKPVVVEAFELTEDFYYEMTGYTEIIGGVPLRVFSGETEILIGEYKLIAKSDIIIPDGAVPEHDTGYVEHTHDIYFLVQTLEDIDNKNLHRAEIGDWLIKGIKGEIYPCKPDIFHGTYDLGDHSKQVCKCGGKCKEV